MCDESYRFLPVAMKVEVDNIQSNDHDSVDLEDDIDMDTDYETNSPTRKMSIVINDYYGKKKCLLMFNDDFRSRLKSDLSALKSKEKKCFCSHWSQRNSMRIKKYYRINMITSSENTEFHDRCAKMRSLSCMIRHQGWHASYARIFPLIICYPLTNA